MSSEKILIKIFNSITEDDFKKDKFLEEVYKCWKKESKNSNNSTLFEFYIEFLIRNKTYNHNEKIEELNKLYKEIVNAIINNDEVTVSFVKNNKIADNPIALKQPTDKKKIILDKEQSIKILSDFVQQSSIITEIEPDIEEENIKVTDIINEITQGTKYVDIHGNEINEEVRIIPKPNPDKIFNRRSNIMNIWRDTETKCQELNRVEAMSNLINKIYFIDTSYINRNLNYINTITMPELDLAEETIKAMYTSCVYDTNVKLLNTSPLAETINKVKDRIKSIYILSGSQMVLGSNADQGIETNESDIYLTSTYSSAIDKILHAFPLQLNQVVICPKVLVFKNLEYKLLPASQWEKIIVMNSPYKFRPKLDDNGDFYNDSDKFQFKKCLNDAIELALFFGYDNIIIDDRGIQDNELPIKTCINIIKDVIEDFHGRIKEIIICIKDTNIYNLFKKYL